MNLQYNYKVLEFFPKISTTTSAAFYFDGRKHELGASYHPSISFDILS
jgi:hypothetical protein